jgi:hypothetical protein
MPPWFAESMAAAEQVLVEVLDWVLTVDTQVWHLWVVVMHEFGHGYNVMA